jgi:hypothetical protein
MIVSPAARQCRRIKNRMQHDWRLVDPDEPPPRRMVCRICGKHVPAEPADDDYELYRTT